MNKQKKEREREKSEVRNNFKNGGMLFCRSRCSSSVDSCAARAAECSAS